MHLMKSSRLLQNGFSPDKKTGLTGKIFLKRSDTGLLSVFNG